MAKEKNLNLKRIGINIPIKLYEEVKKYSNNLGINVTTGFIFLINKGLEKENR